MNKKNTLSSRLVTSIVAVIASILLFAITVYAWISVSSNAEVGSVVSQTGTMDFDYSLIRIENGEVKEVINSREEFINKFVVPGEIFEYALVIKNNGSIGSNVSVCFRNVSSLEYIGSSWNEVSSERIDKIQYAFNYQSFGVKSIANDSTSSIQTAYDEIEKNADKNYFNLEQSAYYMIENEVIGEDVLVLFFRLTYEASCVLPEGMEGNVVSNDYVNQKINISSIVIECH